jgi:hypothetical protein
MQLHRDACGSACSFYLAALTRVVCYDPHTRQTAGGASLLVLTQRTRLQVSWASYKVSCM